GRIEPLPPGPSPREIPRAYGARAEVIAEYRRFEAGAASRDLGRAATEGANEHAGALGHRFPTAAGELAEVAHRFARARYGPGEVEPDAASTVRERAERALRKIDDAVQRRAEEPS